MNKKIHSLALLVDSGDLRRCDAQALAADRHRQRRSTTTPLVITAAEQNLQAPGVSTITADEIRKNPAARDVARRSSAPCLALT